MLARLLAVVALAAAPPPTGPGDDLSILVFTRTAGFRHASIEDGVAALVALGNAHGFAVTPTEDPAAFTDARLASYDAVVFLSTTGDVLGPDQQDAFERYIRGGGGFVGIHAASDTEYDWPWYGRLVGAFFAGHPAVQPAEIVVADRSHPSTRGLPPRWSRTDEWYDFGADPRGRVHVLATLDEATYRGGGMGADHPIAWCHVFEGGRAWYTGGGHTKESFDEPLFREHLLGGIRWAAGRAEADVGATVDASWERTVLDDFVTDPMELAVASDGRVIFVERAGVVKVWKPDTRTTVTAGFIDVFDALEDGLLGVALDPGFHDNGWFYVYYSPAGADPKNVLARLTLEGDRFDPARERILLEVPTQRDECCHSGGSLAFDGRGNLLLSTGDNTSPFASDGFAPIDERPGRGPFDAQKSSANTHDLRGKILRITPRPDGTYTVPAGNLFPRDGSAGRPEIYVMGCRNPFRIAVDRERGWVYWGDVGPDAGAAKDDRDPPATTSSTGRRGRATSAGRTSSAQNLPYVDHDFRTRTSGAPFDPAHPVNTSPNNTGRTDLPPAQPAWIGYPYGAIDDAPALGSGGRCAMAGPIVHLGPDGAGPRGVPAYYDDTVFLYEWARNWIMAVKLHDDGSVHTMHRFLPGFTFTRPHDLELGPDGCLYLIEWGTGFGGGNPDARLVRLEYYGSGPRPVARAAADETSGALPLAVRFDGGASAARTGGGPLAFAWDFDDDGVTDARTPEATFTYRTAGDHRARLTVTDAAGGTAVATVPISAGNTRPVVAFAWPPNGGVCGFGDTVAYRVTVDEPEDDAVAAERVIVEPALGHDTHAHPLARRTGAAGTLTTLRDDGHPVEADLFTVINAAYEDGGGPGCAPLRGRAEVVLQPRRKQAEHTTGGTGTRVEKTDDDDGGGAVLVFEADGASAGIAPLHLHGITAVTARAAVAAGGGRLELRLGADDGPLLGTVPLDGAGAPVLAAGAHAIRVEHFERDGGAGLILRYRRDGGPKAVVPAAWLRWRGAPGLRAAYYELPDAVVLPDFDGLDPYGVTRADVIDFASTTGPFAGSGRADRVGAVFSGEIVLPASGAYAFSLESDDGSRFFVNGTLIVDNDGLHAMTERTTAFRYRDVTVPVTDPGGTRVLRLVWRPDGGGGAPCRLNWLEFVGDGVAAVVAAPAPEADAAPAREHPH